MSIVPAYRLTASDLSRLGNNLRGGGLRRGMIRRRRARGRLVAAVNRSLAGLNERVRRLD
jgi:hypothetical protein